MVLVRLCSATSRTTQARGAWSRCWVPPPSTPGSISSRGWTRRQPIAWRLQPPRPPPLPPPRTPKPTNSSTSSRNSSTTLTPSSSSSSSSSNRRHSRGSSSSRSHSRWPSMRCAGAQAHSRRPAQDWDNCHWARMTRPGRISAGYAARPTPGPVHSKRISGRIPGKNLLGLFHLFFVNHSNSLDLVFGSLFFLCFLSTFFSAFTSIFQSKKSTLAGKFEYI